MDSMWQEIRACNGLANIEEWERSYKFDYDGYEIGKRLGTMVAIRIGVLSLIAMDFSAITLGGWDP